MNKPLDTISEKGVEKSKRKNEDDLIKLDASNSSKALRSTSGRIEKRNPSNLDISNKDQPSHKTDMASPTLAGNIMIRVTFMDVGCDFTNTSWAMVENALNQVSKTWNLYAFSNKHRSAIISEKDPSLAAKIVRLNVIQVQGQKYNFHCEQFNKANRKGMIYNQVIIPMSEDYILGKLEKFGVREIVKLQKNKNGTDDKVYTGSVILVFNEGSFVNEVCIGEIKIQVNSVNPRPMLCSHCGLLGHTAKRCKNCETQYSDML